MGWLAGTNIALALAILFSGLKAAECWKQASEITPDPEWPMGPTGRVPFVPVDERLAQMDQNVAVNAAFKKGGTLNIRAARWTKIAVVLGFATAVFNVIAAAHAQDRLAVYGAGNMPCTGWLHAREHRRDTEADVMRSAGEMWLLGYLSAANVYELHFSAKGPLTAESIFVWIDSYCLAHPDDRINAAIQAMIAGSRLKR